MKIVQKILFFGLLIAMQSFSLQGMPTQNFSNNLDNNNKKRKNNDNELFNQSKKKKQESALEKRARNSVYRANKKGMSELTRHATLQESTLGIKQVIIPVPKGHVRLVFDDFYEEKVIGAVESKKERNEEESENYVKVDFYEDIPYDVALLSGYIKEAVAFKAQQKSLSLESVSIFHDITQDGWKEIYHLMTKAYEIKSTLEETKSMMKEDNYEYSNYQYGNIDFDVDFEVTRYMYVHMQEQYKDQETSFFASMFDLVTFLDIPLIEKPLHFIIFNRCRDEGQPPIEIERYIERYEALKYQLNEFNEAIDQKQSLEELVNKKLLPQIFLQEDKLTQLTVSFKHLNHPMMKHFTHLKENLINIRDEYIESMRGYIISKKVAGTRTGYDTTVQVPDEFPPLTDLIKEYNAQEGDHTYIALFVLYCLAHTEQELVTKKTDLESLTHGKTLFQIAQQIKRFQSGLDDPEKLCLSSIFKIGDVLENLLDILQGLTTKAITNLDLSKNKLTIIPYSIRNFTQLKFLNLSNNMLKDLPYSIGYLTQLENLDLSHNKLTILPDSIIKCTRLKVLNLIDNQLTKIPVGLFRQGLIVYKDSHVFFTDQADQNNHFCIGSVEFLT